MSKKILIAEDEADLRAVLKEMLEANGYQVLEAADGDACINILVKDTPDLLVLDLVMPNKDGLDVLNGILLRPEIKNVPVIVLTNMSDFGTKHKALMYGARHYMVKVDTTPDELVRKVKSILG